MVAGNRRWTAAHDAGLIEVPALIRAMSDQEARLIAALENQVRADLTPIEEAQHAVILLEDMANDHLAVMGDDREFGKNRTLSFASSCNQFIVFSMDERKWRKLFDKQIGIL